MLKPYMYAVLFSEIIAAIFATLYYFKYKNTPFKYLLVISWYIVITELVGAYYIELGIYYSDGNGIKYNFFLYNILYFVLFLAYYFMYYKTVRTKKYRSAITVFIVIFIIIYVLNWMFFQNFFTEWVNYPKIIGSIFLTVGIILYFIELLRSNQIISFHRLVPFWISVGLLVFYTSTIPLTVVQNTYMLSKDDAELKMLIIKLVLATAMYLVFTFGFIWSKKE